MASFNKVILIGNLVENPELRQTPSGIPVTNFRIAVSRRFKREGEQDADFISIVAWRSTAESVSQYCGKGSRIAVTGMLTSRKYQDKEGKNRTAIEVVADEVTFLNSKTDEGSAQSSPSTTSTPYNATSEEFAEFVEMSEDSDLPF